MKRLWNMCFPKNFADVLKPPILWNADRLLLPKYLLKFKIAAADKFSEEAIWISFKIGILKNFALITGKSLCWNLFLIKLQT